MSREYPPMRPRQRLRAYDPVRRDRPLRGQGAGGKAAGQSGGDGTAEIACKSAVIFLFIHRTGDLTDGSDAPVRFLF